MQESRYDSLIQVGGDNLVLWILFWFSFTILAGQYIDRRKIINKTATPSPTMLEKRMVTHVPCGEVMSISEIPQHLLFCKERKDPID